MSVNFDIANYPKDTLIGLVVEKDAEIERLKEENAHFAWRDSDKNKLIAELAHAYSADRKVWNKENEDLIKRAWEVMER